jgi:hypothetical protein
MDGSQANKCTQIESHLGGGSPHERSSSREAFKDGGNIWGAATNGRVSARPPPFNSAGGVAHVAVGEKALALDTHKWSCAPLLKWILPSMSM